MSKHRYRNKVHVTLGYGELSSVIRWCDETLTANWNYSLLDCELDHAVLTYDFFFRKKSDAMLFTVKFK